MTLFIYIHICLKHISRNMSKIHAYVILKSIWKPFLLHEYFSMCNTSICACKNSNTNDEIYIRLGRPYQHENMLNAYNLVFVGPTFNCAFFSARNILRVELYQ